MTRGGVGETPLESHVHEEVLVVYRMVNLLAESAAKPNTAMFSRQWLQYLRYKVASG